ncbi:MAG: YjbH domain-containing protein [Betaproteobacteria bacterium]
MNCKLRNSILNRRIAALVGALVLMVFGLSLTGLAAPTVYGPTGLMFVPTADVLPNGGFNFGLHRMYESNYLTFNTSLLDNLEFGVTVVSWPGDSDAQANVKFRLLNETRQGPALAVGVTDLTHDRGRDAYVVLTKSLPEFGFRGSIGIDSDGLIGGLSKELNPVSIAKGGKRGTPGVTFLLDFNDAALSLGLGIGLTPELRANVYLHDLDEAVVGVSYQARF